MSLITLKQVDKALKEIVASKPEGYVYERPEGAEGGLCVYTTPGGSASCIVAEVLDRFGIYRPEWNSAGNAMPWDLFDRPARARFTGDANVRLSVVQRRQDRGVPWAEAIA